MEAEPLELEDGEVVDGEVVDDEPLDAFGPYKVLQRPHTVAKTEKVEKVNYSEDSDNTSESASDSDSDPATKKIKRPKIKVKRRKVDTIAKKSDKYKIWCTQVQEEALTEDLVSCGVTKKMHTDRSIESYNVPEDFLLNGYNLGNSSEDEREAEARSTKKRSRADRKNVKLRLGKRQKRPNSMDVDNQKGSVRTIAALSTTVESTEEEVANDMAEKLNEKKDALIKRVVDIIGKEKAIEFYEKTREIEEDGGMLIMNASRRRTPGGVYLHLVKHDDHLPQEKIREIFAVDKRECSQKKKADERQRIREKAKELMKNGSEKDLPALLTRAELSTRQIAEEARLRRGEGMERNPVDSDRTVSNPPPSPVTDDPDHTEHAPVCHPQQRRIEDYSDDFLDLGADIDSMEVF